MIRSLLISSICLLFLVQFTKAQSTDTVNVTPEVLNAMLTEVVGDTNATGEQLHKVYKLEKGGYYIIDQAVTLKNPVELVSDYPGDGEEPARIISDADVDGFPKTQNLLVTYADISIKNIKLEGIDVAGSERGWGQGQALSVQDSFVTVKLTNIWLENNGWAAISTTSPHTKWYIDNIHARNEQNFGDEWTTFLFFCSDAGVMDTFVVKNTTYFQSNSFFLFPPAVVQYMEIDHNVFANTLKWPFHSLDWLNAKINNNIFYNVGSLGLIVPAQVAEQDRDAQMYGTVNVDTLVANEIGVPGEYTIPENQRKIEVKNNLYYWSSEIQDYLSTHDTISGPVWMNERTLAMFADDANWPGLVAENNELGDPMFNDFAGLSAANARLATKCNDHRGAGSGEWDWDSDWGVDFYRLDSPMPLPENFRSYSGKVGTDGNPVGSLVYYPDDMVGVETSENLSLESFDLAQNYPNPFNPTTNIVYSVKQTGKVKLVVYDIIGKEVATLVNKEQAAGKYNLEFKANNLSSGIYFYSLQTNAGTITKKMMLLK